MKINRGSGILLHVTSLPSQYGIGDLGPQAYQWADTLHQLGQKYWQILPLNPVEGVFGYSPYSSPSAFAGNPLFISPESLIKDSLLNHSDVPRSDFLRSSVDYQAAGIFKNNILAAAFSRFKGLSRHKLLFKRFCLQNNYWLNDYALFSALKKYFNNQEWYEWPREYRDRDHRVLEDFVRQGQEDVQYVKFVQYVFFLQWSRLKRYCHKKNIQIIGDVPIYVNDDSSDVWSAPHFFKLNEDKRPQFVAGVPPDYFSETGQRWGNPVYNWDELKKNRYRWWIKRIEHNLKLYDIVRIDHFRGLVQYWEIPVEEKTAVKGAWKDVPVHDFLDTVKKEFPKMPFIAEDLGIITPDVSEVMDHYHLPGMKVLMFAFDGDLKKHPYIPDNFKTENCIVYTGTHDNNTVLGWLQNDISQEAKKNIVSYFKKEIKDIELAWVMIESAFQSKADLAIIPLQDILSLGQEARMNKPSTVSGNWGWRVDFSQITNITTDKLKKLLQIYNR